MAADEGKLVFTLSYTEPKQRHRRIVERIGAFSQLAQRLDELKTSRTDQYLMGVHLENSSGDGFAIGLADQGWLLIFDDRTRTNMRYSVGNEHAEGYIEYIFEQWECLAKRYLIPHGTALDAMRIWMETGKLSDTVRWEDDPY